MRAAWSTWLARLGWTAVAVLTVAIATAGFWVDLPEPRDAIAINRAIHTHGESPPEQVMLPHTVRRLGASPAAARYEASFDLAAVPETPLYLYVPVVNEEMTITLNGHSLFDSGTQSLASPLASTAMLVHLPQPMLAAGRNEIVLAFYAGPMILARQVPRLYVGSEAALSPNFKLRVFVQERLRTIALGGQLLIGVGVLFAYCYRPRDPLFSWMAALVVLASIVALGLFTGFQPDGANLWPTIVTLAPSVGFVLIGFALALNGTPPPRALQLLAIAVSAVLATAVLSGLLTNRSLIAAISLPPMIVSFTVACGIIAYAALRPHNTEARLLLAPFVLMTWFAARDMGVAAGLIDGSTLLSAYGRLLFLAAATAVLMRRLALSLDQLDQANENLNQKLAAREAELAILHRQERLEAAQRVREQERQRLTHDLHDGISGHLVSIIAMAERADTGTKPIEQAAREALDDLRLVIYSLELGDRELPLALANFRERLIPQLQRIGVALDWSTARLPEVSGVTPGNALTILRILQEAITNALKHGPARNITIRGAAIDGGMAAITVENDGRPFAGTGQGHGLGNMRRRAGALAGELRLEALSAGTRLTLLLPTALPDVQDESAKDAAV
jgi:two-component system sensor histidine kinase UhpB